MTTIKEQLDPMFRPESVAIIGATNDLRRWGGWVVERPQSTGYKGKLIPVNPNQTEVQGLKAYPSILDVPDEIDMAMIVVRSHLAPQVMADCVTKGVKSAIVISAGFAEAGPEGAELQAQMVAAAQAGGLRFAGPNCQGIYTSATNFNVMWPTTPQPGGIAIVSQSGSFAAGLGAQLNARGFGVRVCLSIGNAADLSMADYLEYLAQDDETRAICLYVEGFKDGRRFYEAAKALAPEKPILLLHPGRTPTGARTTMSHTASLAVPDLLVDALCEQAGVIRAPESDHLMLMADAVATAGPSAGRRVAITSGAGAQCVIISDACDDLGLELPVLDADTQAKIQAITLPHAPPPLNPVDLGGPGQDPAMQTELLEILSSLDYIDCVIASPIGVGSGESLTESQEALMQRVLALPEKTGTKLILSGFRGSGADDSLLKRYKDAGIPAFFGEDCARAAYALARYGETQRGV